MAPYDPIRAFHDAACVALEIRPGHGSQAAMARVLGLARTNYHRALVGTRGVSQATMVGWVDTVERASGRRFAVEFRPQLELQLGEGAAGE